MKSGLFGNEVEREPPAERHWHGAAPTTAMSHIAIQEALDRTVVDWMEKRNKLFGVFR
ncbi:MAG TPA: hypothetical protein VKY92_05355 [Verrucomicrobiae bacterium]|nr:hypothetical protein [Verrucomicrobiae bacterium]